MIIFAVLSAAFLVFLIFFNRSIHRTPLLADDGSTYETGVVTKITQDNIDENGVRAGNQQVVVRLTSGKYRGKEYPATSTDGYLYGATCKVGTRVTVSVSSYKDTVACSIYNYNREPLLVVFLLCFCALVIAVGGRKGVSALVGLFYTFICVLFFYLPLLYLGCDPILAAVLCCLIVTFFTLILLGGFSKKTLAAVIGTMAGCLFAGLVAKIFGSVMHLSSYNLGSIETLLFVQENSKLRLGNLLFSGILISSLGAVMDVAMSIASSMSEIDYHSPDLPLSELFRSGINVGRDMMGTDVNTLVLAFVGNSTSALICYYAYAMPHRQLLNSYFMGIQILQGLSGTFGVVFTVPLVSLTTALLYKSVGRRSTAAKPAGRTTEREERETSPRAKR